MTATAPAARKPLTTTTWATLTAEGAYLSADYAQAHGLYWTHLADLGAQLAADHAPHLTERAARVLVDLCVSGVPISLTWAAPLFPEEGTEVTTAAVIVEYVSTRAVRVRYCGFGHWVYLSQIRAAAPVETVRTYEH